MTGTALAMHNFGLRYVSPTQVDIYVKQNLKAGYRDVNTFFVSVSINPFQ